MAHPMKLPFALVIVVSLLLLLSVLLSEGGQSFSNGQDNGSGQPPTPVLVELFTSEGCSSCPPADRLLSDLVNSQPVGGADIIVLSQHVDYWNDLGWADPFSSPQFTERQTEYSQFFSGGRIYTPQMVVDGQQAFVGSQKGKALWAIESAARSSKGRVDVLQVKGTGPGEGTHIQIRVSNLPKLQQGETADVWLAVIESNLQTKVLRGENAGQQLRHDGVVRMLRKIGVVSDSSANFSRNQILKLKDAWKRDALQVVVFAQSAQSRKVVAAGAVPLT